MTARASIRLLLDEAREQTQELQDKMDEANALIEELKAMMTAAMEVMDQTRHDDIREMVDANTHRLNELAEIAETVAPINDKLDKLYAATQAMAEKVDADAEPVTPYTETFINNN